MADTTASRPETLVALDFDNALDIQPVLDFVGDALLGWADDFTPHWRTGEPVRTHFVTFDARKVRNTEVHGKSFRTGFTGHIAMGWGE